jgi:hypothetical protein
LSSWRDLVVIPSFGLLANELFNIDGLLAVASGQIAFAFKFQRSNGTRAVGHGA